ncbi:MAG: hypothetical protein KatS3mg081_2408 [Gemmatimonadales bacterium]|nr:MAG: hypothetical protein KatS3mg081_2408 [Gemmatimonadales bacterium]
MRILSLTLVLCMCAGCCAELTAQAPEYETTRIADGVYQFRYRTHNAFFVIAGDGVVAVDPISVEAASRYVQEIRRVAPGAKLHAVVYSHDHADHATGANVLRRELGPDAPIIAHVAAHAKIAAASNPDLPPPTLTFSDRLALHFGGRVIELHYLGKSHSDNMIVVLLPAERIAFAVDFVSNDRVGFRDLPDYYFPDLFDALARLEQLPFDRIVFGHGPPGDKRAVVRQRRYYADLREAVEQAVRRGLSEDQAAREVRLPQYESWGGYGDWFPLNVRAMYRWLASQR